MYRGYTHTHTNTMSNTSDSGKYFSECFKNFFAFFFFFFSNFWSFASFRVYTRQNLVLSRGLKRYGFAHILECLSLGSFQSTISFKYGHLVVFYFQHPPGKSGMESCLAHWQNKVTKERKQHQARRGQEIPSEPRTQHGLATQVKTGSGQMGLSGGAQRAG